MLPSANVSLIYQPDTILATPSIEVYLLSERHIEKEAGIIIVSNLVSLDNGGFFNGNKHQVGHYQYQWDQLCVSHPTTQSSTTEIQSTLRIAVPHDSCDNVARDNGTIQ